MVSWYKFEIRNKWFEIYKNQDFGYNIFEKDGDLHVTYKYLFQTRKEKIFIIS